MFYNQIAMSRVKLSKQLILLIVSIFLICFSGIFRLFGLNNLPSGFFGDEAALAYNGLSIWQTGRDEWGQKFPLTMRSFDDYKPAIYAYLTIPFVANLGLTHAAARFPAAVAGTLLPLLVFWLVYLMKKKIPLALLTAMAIILAPWHWEVSRTAIEAGVALAMTIGVFILLKQRNWKWVLLGFGMSFLVIFTYHTARLLLPILLLSGWWFKQLPRKKHLVLFAVGLFLYGLFLSFTASGSRFKQISIFSDREGLALRLEAIREDGVSDAPYIETRMYHNKPITWARTFIQSYIKQTSIEYLFYGGAQPPRVRIPETGQFLLIFLPFFILGLASHVRRYNDFDKWILFWWFISPVPASLTSAEIPHEYRTLFMLVPSAIIIARGLITANEVLQNTLKKLPHFFQKKTWYFLMVAAFTLFVSFNTGYSWHEYAIHQAQNKPWFRQYGYQALVDYLNQLPDEAKGDIFITQIEMEPYIFFLYYNNIPPTTYQAWPEKRIAHTALESGETTWHMFDYTFVHKECPYNLEDTSHNNLYIVGKTCELPIGFERICKIPFKDDSTMFFVDRPNPEAAAIPNSTKVEYPSCLEAL